VIKVLVADDHHLVRQGLRQVLDEEPDMEVTGEAINASELLSQAREKNWDVVLLDISLPDRSGLEVMGDIKAMCPEGVVLILSMHSEGQYVVQALKEGAAGYVTKGGTAEEVVEAIRKVVRGGIYISPSLTESLSKE
jgi:two-component system invasion response regulator UvrY